VKEKVDTYARLPEKSWGDGRHSAELMTPEVFEQIVQNDESDIVNALIQDSAMPDESMSKVKEAGTTPIFHD
jgi:hypothetical protein